MEPIEVRLIPTQSPGRCDLHVGKEKMLQLLPIVQCVHTMGAIVRIFEAMGYVKATERTMPLGGTEIVLVYKPHLKDAS